MDKASFSSSDDIRQYKVVVLGNGAVGKTSLIHRYCDAGFEKSYKQTIGLDFYSKRVRVPRHDEEVSVQIWDIGGQQIGGSMLANYISGSDAICFVFDVTNRASFKDVEEWKECVVKACEGEAKTCVMALVGNKVDLPQRQVTSAAQEEFAKKHDMQSFEASARSGEGVNALFTKVAADLMGVKVKKTDLDLADRVTANLGGTPTKSDAAAEDPVVALHAMQKTPKKTEDCVVM